MNKRLVLEHEISECEYDSDKVRITAEIINWDYKQKNNKTIIEIKFSDGFKYIKRWSPKDVKAMLKKHQLDRASDIVIEDFLVSDTSDLGIEQHFKVFGIAVPKKEDYGSRSYEDKEDDFDL